MDTDGRVDCLAPGGCSAEFAAVTTVGGAYSESRPGLTSVKTLVFLISSVTFGNFNPDIFGVSDAVAEAGQKSVALSLWALLIAMTFLPGVKLRPSASTGLALPVLLLCYVVLSAAWSGEPGDSAGKATVLVMTSVGAWRLNSTLRTDEFFRVITYSLTGLVLGSVILVLLVPSIGIVHYWQHLGQWSGMFASKQTLAKISALLTLFSLLGLFYRASLVRFIGFVAGIACVAGSGSRGGAVLAVTAVACVLLARRSPTLASVMAALPAALLALATGVIVFLVSSGLPYLPLFGQKVDLTERTLIWHYALDAWTNRSFFGFGINGFWTDPDYYELFLREHGWVLDNYHNGFVSILVEYGLFGFLLFWTYVLVLCRRLRPAVTHLAALTEAERFGVEAAFGFVILFFTLNLTETFFLRSTDFTQASLAFVTILLFTGQFGTTQARLEDHAALRPWLIPAPWRPEPLVEVSEHERRGADAALAARGRQPPALS